LELLLQRNSKSTAAILVTQRDILRLASFSASLFVKDAIIAHQIRRTEWRRGGINYRKTVVIQQEQAPMGHNLLYQGTQQKLLGRVPQVIVASGALYCAN
jgi:hypothetical protein